MEDEPPDLQSTKRSSADSNEEPCFKKKKVIPTSESTGSNDCEVNVTQAGPSTGNVRRTDIPSDEEESLLDGNGLMPPDSGSTVAISSGKESKLWPIFNVYKRRTKPSVESNETHQNDDSDIEGNDVSHADCGETENTTKNNDRETEGIERHDGSHVESDDESDHGSVYRFSIYKLHHSFLKTDKDNSKDGKTVFNDATLERKIKDLLLNQLCGIEHLEDEQQNIGDWNISRFVYKIEKDKNITSERLEADLTQHQIDQESDESASEDENLEEKRHQIPGHRNTTNMVVFYQILNEQPLVFFLLDSIHPYSLLYYADPSFPVEVANHLMDSTKIQQLETINIAGASLKTSKTFLESRSKRVPFDGPTWCMLNEIVIHATSSIDKSKEDISFLINSKKKENVSLTVGQYFARVKKYLTLEQHSKFLTLLVSRNENVKGKPFYNFGYVHRIVKNDARQISENMKVLKQKTVEYFLNENPQNHNLSIYHPCVMDWVATNKVILYNAGKNKHERDVQRERKTEENKKKRKKHKVREWCFSPGLPEIREALQMEYKEDLKEVLQSDDFKLSFQVQNKSEIDDLIKYVHGNIVDSKGVTHHRISHKWYRVTGEYSDIIDKSFVELMDNCYLNSEKDQSGYPKLPLPWRKTDTFSQKELMDYFDLGEDDAEKLLKILTETTCFVKQTDLMCDVHSRIGLFVPS